MEIFILKYRFYSERISICLEFRIVINTMMMYKYFKNIFMGYFRKVLEIQLIQVNIGFDLKSVCGKIYRSLNKFFIVVQKIQDALDIKIIKQKQ